MKKCIVMVYIFDLIYFTRTAIQTQIIFKVSNGWPDPVSMLISTYIS